MIELRNVSELDYEEILNCRIAKDQEKYMDNALGILARGYLYREHRARVLGIFKGQELLGLMLIKDLEDEPSCYDLQQFMIKEKEQGKGYGKEALALLLRELSLEGKYPRVDLAVDSDNIRALDFFRRNGFKDTYYVDESCPHLVSLSYELPRDRTSYDFNTYEYLLNPNFLEAFQAYFNEMGIDLGQNPQKVLEGVFKDSVTNLSYTIKDPSGKVLGFILFEINEMTHYFLKEKIGFIREFWVQKDLRTKGYGSGLLKNCEKYFKDHGVKRVILTTDTVPKFYEKHGYKLYEGMVANNHDPVFMKFI